MIMNRLNDIHARPSSTLQTYSHAVLSPQFESCQERIARR